ncbi:LAMI_0H17612g1_1 [Lachancea mirantina]|uniref:Small nuclear ribonucleoprotein Sm D3 n=1 Tax=Lachancea mirantina TaxID=1230905 RepID=A0A1G4KJ80_9SACH|nr:LAMI_0H17612g1_1 [Lachancea mirantina]
MGKLGIPVKLLNESQGHIVSLELTSGETYRGKLIDNEDNMNVQLQDVTVTSREGSVTHMDNIFIRGSQVRFLVLPDILKNAPLLKTDLVSKPPPPIRGPKRR